MAPRVIVACTLLVQFSVFGLPTGFVYITDVIPSIHVNLRYRTNENFVGSPIDGYRRNVGICTDSCAQALKKAQQQFLKDGYCIVLYDAYRPRSAVDHFMRWSKNPHANDKQHEYYPYVHKKDIPGAYVARRSAHSRGSCVDISLIKCGKILQPLRKQKRVMSNGTVVPYLDDGTIDAGTSFDYFGSESHTTDRHLTQQQLSARKYLRKVMVECGFKPIHSEWWHFTLINEPFPQSYFNFPVE